MSRKQDAIRFAVGRPDGPRSATWRVWVERDGSVYVGARVIAGHLKASLHGSGDWRIAFSDLEKAKALALGTPPTSRVLDGFAPTPEAAPGIRRAFTVLIPWQAVGAPPDGKPERGDITWLPELAEGHVAECFVVLTAPHVKTETWPGERGMGTRFVGRLPLLDGATVWVVCRTRPVLPAEVAAWRVIPVPPGTHERVRVAATPDSNFRMVLIGALDDGSRWFVDLRLPWPQEAPA